MTAPSEPTPQQWSNGQPPPPGPGPGAAPPAWAAGYVQPPPPPPPKRKVWPWALAGAAAVLVLVAAISAALLTSTPIVLRGEVLGSSSLANLSLANPTGFYHRVGNEEECAGHGGYQDIRGGAVVTVYDSAGSIVGTGQLQRGVGEAGSCTFAFEIPDIPASDFYQVEVSHRGKLTYNADDVERGIQMTIGD